MKNHAICIAFENGEKSEVLDKLCGFGEIET